MPSLPEIVYQDPAHVGAALAAQWDALKRPGHQLPWPWVLMHANSRAYWTVFLLGPEGARITEGYSEWQLFERPRRTAVTEWKGRRNLRLEIDALYDGWVAKRSVEYEIKKLEDLAETAPGADDPTVKCFGPVPRTTAKRWCIDGLEWGDSIRTHGGNGERYRQQVTIKLLEYVAPEGIIQLPPEAKTKWYTIVRGDDLQKIAKKTLGGKASRWKEIEKLNKGMRGIKLNTKLFPAGKKILVPAK